MIYAWNHMLLPYQAVTSFLRDNNDQYDPAGPLCQCPLGLLPHFYKWGEAQLNAAMEYVSMPSRAVTSFLR